MPRKYSPAKAVERIAFLRARIAGDSAEIAVLSPKVETPDEPSPTPAPPAPDLLARRAALVDELSAIDSAIEGERATLRQRLVALDLALHRPPSPVEKPRHAPPLEPCTSLEEQPETAGGEEIVEAGGCAPPVVVSADGCSTREQAVAMGAAQRRDPGPIPAFLVRDRAAASET